MDNNLKSIWQKVNISNYDKLEKDIKCEILVIGGGIAGLLSAYELTKRGHEVVLVEANAIMDGVTANTTAVITSGHGLIYHEIAKQYSLDFAKKYYLSQENAIDNYEQLINDCNIDCDFKRVESYIFSRTETKDIKDEFETFVKMGANVAYFNEIEALPELEVKGVIKQNKQAQFEPLKFLSGLPKNFRIYENSRVIDVDSKKCIAYTANAKVTAKKIVIATHYPIVNFPGMTFLKEYQSMSYSAAFLGVKDVLGAYCEDREDGITLRSYRNLLIVGGFDHRTGRLNENEHFEKLVAVTKKLFPDAKLQTKWLAEDSVTFDMLPIASPISKNNENLYVITGFNKWGMANAMASALIIADNIEKKNNIFADVFCSRRGIIKNNVFGFIKNIGVVSKGILTNCVCIPIKSVKNLKVGDSGIFLIKGKKMAVYKDAEGELHKISSTCPHMHCVLKFNKEALSWDCPCHGSRFDVDGKIITEPSTKKPTKY